MFVRFAGLTQDNLSSVLLKYLGAKDEEAARISEVPPGLGSCRTFHCTRFVGDLRPRCSGAKGIMTISSETFDEEVGTYGTL